MPLIKTSFDDAIGTIALDFPAPVIAMVQGSAWGGACDLVMACDLVCGDPSCTFAITPAKIGVPYDLGGLLNFVSRLPLNVVKEMSTCTVCAARCISGPITGRALRPSGRSGRRSSSGAR